MSQSTRTRASSSLSASEAAFSFAGNTYRLRAVGSHYVITRADGMPVGRVHFTLQDGSVRWVCTAHPDAVESCLIEVVAQAAWDFGLMPPLGPE